MQAFFCLVTLASEILAAGVALGDVAMSFFVARAALGDVGFFLFPGKRSIGEVWVEGPSAKCCHFHMKMHCCYPACK